MPFDLPVFESLFTNVRLHLQSHPSERAARTNHATSLVTVTLKRLLAVDLAEQKGSEGGGGVRESETKGELGRDRERARHVCD